MNVPAFLPAIWLFLAAGIARAQPLDEAKPYGRAAVTAVNAAAKSETLLTAGTLPGSERFVTVHLDASAPCEAVVAAFAKKDGRLAFGWWPAVADKDLSKFTAKAQSSEVAGVLRGERISPRNSPGCLIFPTTPAK